MRLAFVTPRYGTEILGGAETQVRDYAERLASAGHSVEVLTSCAVDHHTWANALPPGESLAEGVRVRALVPARVAERFARFAAPARLIAK